MALEVFRATCQASQDAVVLSARPHPVVLVSPPIVEGKGAIDPRARMASDGVMHLTYGSCVRGAMDGYHCDQSQTNGTRSLQ